MPKDFNNPWQLTFTVFDKLAELANSGIIADAIVQLFPMLPVFCTFLRNFSFFADPLIYLFRGLATGTKTIGTEYAGITFHEDRYGAHPLQKTINLLRIALFALALPLFFGFIISPPVGTTVAWALAVSSMSLTAYFDYRHRAIKAAKYLEEIERILSMMEEEYRKEIDLIPSITEKEYLEEIQRIRSMTEEEYREVYRDAQKERNSYRLYLCIIGGVAFLSLCGSAALYAPPILDKILEALARLASGFLGTINVGRLVNSYYPSLGEFFGLSDEPRPRFKLRSTSTSHSLSEMYRMKSGTSFSILYDDDLDNVDDSRDALDLEAGDQEQQYFYNDGLIPPPSSSTNAIGGWKY